MRASGQHVPLGKKSQKDKRQKGKTTHPDFKSTIPTNMIFNFRHVGRNSSTR